MRQTDNANMVFEGFTLAFYCVLRQDSQTLQMVINEEKDTVLPQTTVLNL